MMDSTQVTDGPDLAQDLWVATSDVEEMDYYIAHKFLQLAEAHG